jgi:phosphoacetylglucosamine mutase
MAQDNAALLALLAANPVPQGLIHAYGIFTFIHVFINFRSVLTNSLYDARKTLAGTAGFRALATTLPHVMVRVGALAALRSRTQGGAAIGVMVTASHNAERDNGVKIVDPMGDMLVTSWEAAATRLANADGQAAIDELNALGDEFGARSPADVRARVIVGCDLRESSPALLAKLIAGAEAAGATVVSVGVVTTPQLHFCVRTFNLRADAAAAAAAASGAASSEAAAPLAFADVPRLLDEYYASIGDAFSRAIDLVEQVFPASLSSSPSVPLSEAPMKVCVDCANGVGARALHGFRSLPAVARLLTVSAVNDQPAPGAGTLNNRCGAEHVQKSRTAPTGLDAACVCAYAKGGECGASSSSSSAAAEGADRVCTFASLDGDADRLVLFYFEQEAAAAAASDSAPPAMRLLDGDKITALLTAFLQDVLVAAALPAADALSIGVVQTAYANGASTLFIERSLGVPVACVPTGVKHLHHRAAEFDIGVYFEANGHGTVVFSERMTARIVPRALASASAVATGASHQMAALQLLALLPTLVNQAVGDACSDLLLVLCVLRARRWSLPNWDAIYADLPSRQTKVAVADRCARTISLSFLS